MAFVVCEPCVDCKYTDCVVVCPCDCFYDDSAQLYIDPVSCIDCEACMPECPVDAIFPETQVPVHWQSFIALNEERVLVIKANERPITEQRAPLLGLGCKKKS